MPCINFLFSEVVLVALMSAFSENGAIAMIERNEAQTHRLLNDDDHDGGGPTYSQPDPAGSIAKPPNGCGDGPGRDGHPNGR